MIIVNVDKVKGKNLFHVKYINLSYRIRGYDARTQINKDAKIIVNITRVKWFTISIGVLPIKNV